MYYVFFALLFALLVAVFAIQNYLQVTVAFLFWSFQTSLVIVILGAATFGAMVVLCLALLMQFRLRRALNRERQIFKELEGENTVLKQQLAEQTTKNMTKDDG